jgi:2-polyprenyl-3-methyl-5-hydroxy-6-metoxy-1,4-benzoquinol methylase
VNRPPDEKSPAPAGAAPSDDTQSREREFYNKVAADLELGADGESYRLDVHCLSDPALPWLPYMGMPRLVGTLLDALGDLRGKQVLDIGAGTGFLSVALALRGAQVTSTDIAEQALAVGRHRARISGVADRIEFVTAASEDLPFPDQSFDAVAGIFALHHLDLARAGPTLRRILKPAGTAAFIETMACNPLLMFCRTHLAGRYGIGKAGSDDESPLSDTSIALFAKCIDRAVRVDYPDLTFMRMAAANIPLMRGEMVMRALLGLDRLLWRYPGCHRLSYFGVLSLEPVGSGSAAHLDRPGAA